MFLPLFGTTTELAVQTAPVLLVLAVLAVLWVTQVPTEG